MSSVQKLIKALPETYFLHWNKVVSYSVEILSAASSNNATFRNFILVIMPSKFGKRSQMDVNKVDFIALPLEIWNICTQKTYK